MGVLFALVCSVFQLFLHLNSGFATEVVGDSPGWHAAAEHLEATTNPKINPCFDFYEFACGGFAKKLKDDHQTGSLLEVANTKVSNVLQEAFESTSFSPSEAINKAKSLYKSCMDKELRESSKELVKEIDLFGGWPLIEGRNWNASRYNLTNLLIQTELTRDLRIQEDQLNSVFFKSVPIKHITKGTWTVSFTRGELSVDEDAILEPEEAANAAVLLKRRRELDDIIDIVAEQAGLERYEKSNRIRNEVDAMFAFELELAKVFALKIDEDNEDFTEAKTEYENGLDEIKKLRDAEGNLMVNLDVLDDATDGLVFMRQLPSKLFKIDWKRFFGALVSSERLDFMMTNNVVVIDWTNFLQISGVMDLLNRTEPRVVQNYVVYRFLKRNKVDLAYGGEYTRLQVCIADVTEKMRYATSAIYIQDAFSEVKASQQKKLFQTSRPLAKELANNLKESFDELLVENDWLDNKTRSEARKKLKEMIFVVAAPDISANFTLLDQYYKELNLRFNKPYLALSREVTTWKNKRLYAKPLERGSLNAPITEVNAEYLVRLNQLVINAAILQEPAFSETFPMSLNYGGAGTIIGHEMTHGFDDNGAAFDTKGNLHNWWTKQSEDRFEKKRTGLITQYSKVTAHGSTMKLNGENTLGENLADIGGIREAFRAYQNYIKKHGTEERLPGAFRGYTHEQLFFIGFAQPWCGYATPGQVEYLIRTDPHTPDRHRVLKDTAEFANAYKCPVGMPMNPETKITVWAV